MLRQTMAYYKKWIPIIVSMASLCVTHMSVAESWRMLAPGIEYTDLYNNLLIPWSHIHAFRVNLSNNKLSLVMANELSLHNASIDAFAHHSKALITLNGGFFDQEYHPLGLRISNQHRHNPLKHISWWGIFYIKHNKAFISSVTHFNDDKTVDFAIQSGPRLIVNGKTLQLKSGYAERSALGITPDGHIIVLVTHHFPMTTTNLAQLMKSPPLNCINALNLDGGSSSQLNASMGLFQINDHGFANVSDAIVVKPK
jgi:uncharacterized protein YigE (DUF2233 family)